MGRTVVHAPPILEASATISGRAHEYRPERCLRPTGHRRRPWEKRMAESATPGSGRDALAAVGRVLAVIGAAFELQPMLDRIAAEATQLCRADLGFVFLREGELIHFVAGIGGSPEHREFEREHPFPATRDTVGGRVFLSNGPIHI